MNERKMKGYFYYHNYTSRYEDKAMLTGKDRDELVKKATDRLQALNIVHGTGGPGDHVCCTFDIVSEEMILRDCM